MKIRAKPAAKLVSTQPVSTAVSAETKKAEEALTARVRMMVRTELVRSEVRTAKRGDPKAERQIVERDDAGGVRPGGGITRVALLEMAKKAVFADILEELRPLRAPAPAVSIIEKSASVRS